MWTELPYIATANTQKLREVIEAYGSALGTTEAGKAWCIKALHPSDPLTEVRGVPDESTQASVFLNMQEEVQITSPAAGSWDLDINVLSDPACPVSWYANSGGTTAAGTQHNTMSATTTVAGASDHWFQSFQRWRCAYVGASCYLTANSLANEGAVAAAQYSYKARNLTTTYGSGGEDTTVRACRYKISHITPYDNPDYSNLVKMPNVYTGEAKDGVYMPLKLDGNHQHWHDEEDMSYSVPYATGSTYVMGTTAGTGVHPYWTSNTASLDTVNKALVGGLHLQPCTNCLGKIDFRGLNKDAKVTVIIRFGFEVQAYPDSSYAAFQALPPEFDAVAVAAYFKIARQLKDAYPVSYNDLGKLWDVIKGVASVVNPFLDVVPGGQMIRMAGKGIGMMGDMIREKKSRPGAPSDGPSMAQVERATEQVKESLKPRAPKRKVGALRPVAKQAGFRAYRRV